MEVEKIQLLINKAKGLRDFYNTYNNLHEYNAEKDEDQQFVELTDKFYIGLGVKNGGFLCDDRIYMHKYALRKESSSVTLESPWIDLLCFGKDKNGEITNLLDMDLDSAKLFWKGFEEYINLNKEEIFDYISTYMLANISEKYKDDLKKEKEKIEKMINTL